MDPATTPPLSCDHDDDEDDEDDPDGRPAVVVDYDFFCPFLPDFAFKSL